MVAQNPPSRSMLMLSLVAVLAIGAPALAAMQVHVSSDNYYANGTNVDIVYDIFGATDFTVGQIAGEILWEITEKAWWDTSTNQTIISYTMYNDAFAQNITSLHVPVPAGIVAASVLAPPGWTGAQVGNEIIWQTAGVGIPMFESLDTMIVRYNGLYPIVFMPNVVVDFADQTAMSSPNWVVTTVPEPVTVLLLALGGWAITRRR